MRLLFIGIAVMALGLVLFGTFAGSDRAPAATKTAVSLPDRYVKVIKPAREDDRRAKGDEGRLGNGLLDVTKAGADRGPRGMRPGAATRQPAPATAAPMPQGSGAVAQGVVNDPASAVQGGEDAKGFGGLGLRGVGRGGGGDGAGRIGGLGKIDAGGGKGRRVIALDSIAIEGKEAPDAGKDVRLDDGEFAQPKAPAPVMKPKPRAEPPPPPAQLATRLSGKKKRKPMPRKRPAFERVEKEVSEITADLDGLDQLAKAPPATLPPRLDLSVLGARAADRAPADEVAPARFLPRMCYFENTYLGGNAAFLEQRRRVIADLGETPALDEARLERQAFDPPQDAGMALSASLDRVGLQQPGRVVLQVGLQGSQRYGWRRPPLDVVLVVDARASAHTQAAAKALLDRLSPRDRLGIVRAGDAAPLAPVAAVRATRDLLLDAPEAPTAGGAAELVQAMDRAGRMLVQAAGDAARVPGSQTVIVLGQGDAAHAQAAQAAAHRLQVQGAVVSVIDLADDGAGWWAVANAGHGNFHRAGAASIGQAVEAELASLSKVVARLLRLNVRLGPQAEGVRVIGSRVLGQDEVKAVKAREVATDRNLSKTMGVKANRGDDDDGIQTVIPYFYGGDSHVVLIELWVDPAKGSLDQAVAEVSLKYKDMVNLDNATARTAVYLGRRPAPDTAAQRFVKRNLAGFAFAAALDQAADHAAAGDWKQARQVLSNHAGTPRDRAVARAFEQLLNGRTPRVSAALRLAARQRKGRSPEEVR